jgi:DNA-binding MarR family transcriptional regulator
MPTATTHPPTAPPALAQRLAAPAAPAAAPQPEQLLNLLRRATLAGVASNAPDLSARQLAVLLEVYLTEGALTVRDLAASLNVAKPAITRALDRLCELDLAARHIHPTDRRMILVRRTLAGAAHVSALRTHLTAAWAAAA